MGTRTEVKSAASISDAAVSTATGKGWKEWFSILDKAGARKMEHKAIARLLHDEQGVGDWWRQMVTVEYERVRGPRENYQGPEGFRVSIGKTIAVPIENLFDDWADTGKRKATPSKSMRVTWPDGTSLEVNFYSKGDCKSQVSVQHSKLKGTGDVANRKTFWSAALSRLKDFLK